MSSLIRFVLKFSDFLNFHIFGYNRIVMNEIFAMNTKNELNSKSNENNSLIDDLMSNGFVFATQKKRRTVEKRLVRRFGVERYPQSSAMIRPKQNIIVCDNCGYYHELHTICGHCYQRVKRQTDLIINEMKTRFHCYEPIDKEIEIRFKSDANDGQHMKDKQIIEMDGQRPEWFHKNLLSKTVGNKWVETNVIIKEEEPKVIKD